MHSIAAIEQRRKIVLKEMEALRSMCTASLSEQMLPVKHKGKKKPVMRGPYFVLSRHREGKTCSQRISGKELEQVKKDVVNHKRFIALCKEFEELTERLGELEQAEHVNVDKFKKRLKSPSRRTRR